MKKSRFTNKQMVKLLRETGKAPVAERAKRHGLSEQAIDDCPQHVGDLRAADLKR